MSKDQGNVPEKNSRKWVKNESIIAKNPVLRAARDTAEGFKPSSGITTGANDEQYKQGYDKIQWGKKDPDKKPSFRIKVNGKYQDEKK